MLMSEGIRQYIEPHCVQRELSEVTGMTADELDHAAHELIRRTASDPTSFPTPAARVPSPSVPAAATAVTRAPATGDRPRRPPYYEHLGGYSFDELKDYNRHSSPVEETSPLRVGRPPRPASGAPPPAAGGEGLRRTSAATAAAATAFRAGALRTRAYRSDELPSNDDHYGSPSSAHRPYH